MAKRYAEQREMTRSLCPKCGKEIVRVYGNFQIRPVFGAETYIYEQWFECPCGYSNESIDPSECI